MMLLSLNIPTFSFPMGTATMQGPEAFLTFWPACLLPTACSISFQAEPEFL